MSRISDLILRQGEIEADRQRNSGAVWGNAVAQLGQVPMTIAQMRQSMQQDEQQRALTDAQLKTEGLNQRVAEGRIADQEQERTAALRRQDQDMALRKMLFTDATPDDIIREVGPERGLPIVQGMEALKALQTKRSTDLKLEAGRIAYGLKALPRDLQARSWGIVTKAVIDAGLATPESLPVAPSDEYIDAVLTWSGYQPEKLISHDPTKELVDPTTGRVVRESTPEPVKVSYQQREALVNGQRAFVNYDPATGKSFDSNGQQVDARPIPPQGPQGPQPGWQWVNRNGQEVYTNRVQDGDRPQNARVKATEDERKTAGFYVQMKDAIQTIDALEDSISEKELYQIQTLPQEELIGMLNRNKLSENAKRYLRAFEQFTESRLRPVSGAAINNDEYARDRRTYAKQYGETPKLAEDRQRARALVLGSLKTRAGVALDDADATPRQPVDRRAVLPPSMRGDSAPERAPATTPAPAARPPVGSTATYRGKRYRITGYSADGRAQLVEIQ